MLAPTVVTLRELAAYASVADMLTTHQDVSTRQMPTL